MSKMVTRNNYQHTKTLESLKSHVLLDFCENFWKIGNDNNVTVNHVTFVSKCPNVTEDTDD